MSTTETSAKDPAATEAPDEGAEAFADIARDPSSVTAAGARRWSVKPESFANWRWQMKHQVETAADGEGSVAFSGNEREAFSALKDRFHAGVTPYYAALAKETTDPADPIRLQAFPRLEELRDPAGVADPLGEVSHSPVKEVVQVYPDRVAFCVAQLCPVYCRYCFRKRRDTEDGLHFNRRIVDRGLAYIAETPAIKDVLVTGGDPFIASDRALEGLLERLRAIPHVEIVRFGTRTPVTLPYRVTPRLARILGRFHPIFVNTHFNCVEELTPEAIKAVGHLVDQGIPVGNQSVLLRGVNDSAEALTQLSRALLRARVKPYYLFHPHLVEGTEHLRVPVDRGLRIMKEMRGNITGMGIPTYVVDTPSGKVPLFPESSLGRDGEDLLLEDVRGEIWREPGAFTPNP